MHMDDRIHVVRLAHPGHWKGLSTSPWASLRCSLSSWLSPHLSLCCSLPTSSPLKIPGFELKETTYHVAITALHGNLAHQVFDLGIATENACLRCFGFDTLNLQILIHEITKMPMFRS